jgi:hypothetical protein
MSKNKYKLGSLAKAVKRAKKSGASDKEIMRAYKK